MDIRKIDRIVDRTILVIGYPLWFILFMLRENYYNIIDFHKQLKKYFDNISESV